LGRYQDAATTFKRVIQLDPGMSSDYYNLGLCYLELENYDTALTTWLTALAYNPDNASARKGLAVAYWKRGDYEQAWQAVVDCQTRGIPLDPQFIEQLQQDSGQVGPEA
jgi:tetratricopeptide (TPR) repeat protein